MILLSNDMGGVGMPRAIEVLRSGGSALDAVQAGIEVVEDDPRARYVGYGGDPNALGEMECDAAIISGIDRRAGAVGALRGYRHAIRVARGVMEHLPHVLLVGEGAARYAHELGERPEEMLEESARARYEAWLAERLSEVERARLDELPLAPLSWDAAPREEPKGTTIFLALDGHGDLAAGTSTSGWMYKYPGRLGDSPIVGAGLYARNGAGACGCTHTGEMTIRAGSAARVVDELRRGAGVRDACLEAFADLRELRGGVLGPVVLHAIDARGEPCVLSSDPTPEHFTYWWWRDGLARAEAREPEPVTR